MTPYSIWPTVICSALFLVAGVFVGLHMQKETHGQITDQQVFQMMMKHGWPQ